MVVKASNAPIPHGTMCPVLDTRPEVGLIPAIPQTWAGARMLPPVSLPRSKGTPPEETIAAAPPLLPFGLLSRS